MCVRVCERHEYNKLHVQLFILGENNTRMVYSIIILAVNLWGGI